MTVTASHTDEALLERVSAASLAAAELATMHLGHRLGLYAALDAAGPSTAAELAAAAGVDARYAREWLEQQAAADLLACANPGADPEARRFAIPAGHRAALLDPEHPCNVAGQVRMTAGVFAPLDAVLAAFRTGAGVPYAGYGEHAREGIAEANRPLFAHGMAEWLAAMPGVDARLRAGSARVADLACGCGWSSIAIARAYPGVAVDGLDADPASIERARAHAAAEGLGDRVRFRAGDAGAPGLQGRYDLVTIFEAVHDMAHPVAALRAARALLASGGSVLVGDEAAEEHFAAPADALQRLFYAYSVLHCLPVGRAEAGSAGTGTVMRPSTLREYATDAGFADVQVLDVEHDVWRFYLLRP